MSDKERIEHLEYDVSRLHTQVRNLQSRIEDRAVMLSRIKALEEIQKREVIRQDQVRDTVAELLAKAHGTKTLAQCKEQGGEVGTPPPPEPEGPNAQPELLVTTDDVGVVSSVVVDGIHFVAPAALADLVSAAESAQKILRGMSGLAEAFDNEDDCAAMLQRANRLRDEIAKTGGAQC